MKYTVCFVLLVSSWICTGADSAGRHQLDPVPLKQVTIEDPFWTPKRTTWQMVTIRDAFDKFENDRGGAINNFDRVRDGVQGHHAGPPWYDGLIYEMIRGASDFLAAHPDADLDRRLDGYIARIAAAAAKNPHGYINTYTELEEPGHEWGLNGGCQRWQHEVYNSGALVEAAVHHYHATGKTTLLNVAVRLANYMVERMGPPPKRNIVPAHSLPEEAMVQLYTLFHQNPQLKKRLEWPVQEDSYLKLSEYWIEHRGVNVGLPDWTNWGDKKSEEWVRAGKYGDGRPAWGSYAQDDIPVLQQPAMEGHAVRAALLWSGVAATSAVTGREDYQKAAERVWDNLVERRMYITGGTGAFAKDEKFGLDYQLPNAGYLETCAAVGAGFFHENMGLLSGEARYFDELERVLYNGALGGVSIAGNTYFYENPLEAGKDRTRWVWHTCPCCPPMFLKMMGAMPGYIYATDNSGVYVNLFVGSRAELRAGAVNLSLAQSTRYPWDGSIRIAVNPEKPADFAVYLRLPGWSRDTDIKLNGSSLRDVEKVRGYARIQRLWKKGDTLDLNFTMPVERVHANPLVENNVGRVALMRGPVVYCLESVDNPEPLRSLTIPASSKMSVDFHPELLGGVAVIKGDALLAGGSDWSRFLYLPSAVAPGPKSAVFAAIPYYANTNRGAVDMMVWIPESADGRLPN